MIGIRGVGKSFSDNRVLDNVNLSIADGDIYGLVGVSGAGKSTLLRCINGLETVDEGSVVVDGMDPATLGTRELLEFRRSIGMVFQQFSLMERRTAFENVFLPLACAGHKRKSKTAWVEELLDLVGLADKRNSLPRQLSGGQKQRVAIARALVSNPKLLLCDEATSALDPNVTADVLDLLKKINAELGITTVVVTHEIHVMKSLCLNMGLLHKGALVTTGSVERFFLREPELLTDFSRDAGLKPVGGAGTSLVRVIQDNESGSSFLADLAVRSGVRFELVWGGLDRYRDEIRGSFVLRYPDAEQAQLFAALRDLHVEWSEI